MDWCQDAGLGSRSRNCRVSAFGAQLLDSDMQQTLDPSLKRHTRQERAKKRESSNEVESGILTLRKVLEARGRMLKVRPTKALSSFV